MKKLLSIVTILLLLLTFARADSYSNPACELCEIEDFDTVLSRTLEDEYYRKIINSQLSNYFITEPYTLKEKHLINVLPYNDLVIWHLEDYYTIGSKVCMVLINFDFELTNIIKGTPCGGNVIFDFSLVSGDTYYMFLYSNY